MAVRDSLIAIDQFGIKLSLPLVLSLMRDWQAGALKLAHIRDTLSALESFHILFNAVTEQRATGGLAMMFASLANQLSNKEPNLKHVVCKDVRQKLRERLPDYDSFLVAFRKIIFTKKQTKHRNLVKYILDRMAAHHGWAFDSTELSIEHLLSQASKKVPESTVGQIGNLLLVPAKQNNEQLRDRMPKEKIAILRKSQYPIPAGMGHGDPWGEEQIEKHTAALSKLCYDKIFAI